jgi:integrase
MQWKHLRPHKQIRDAMVYSWVGKGAKAENEQIPDDAWDAIVHYLKLDGRWVPGLPAADQPLAPDDFIFRPLPIATTGQLRNVPAHVPQPGDNKALSPTSALRVLRTALRRAGVPNAGKYRVHDLRHTFAGMMEEDGATESEIMVRLHHSSLDTTGRYLKTLHKKRVDKVDTRGRRLYQQLLAFADGDGTI